MLEQSYSELNVKYGEVLSVKQFLQKEVMELQFILDYERNSQRQMFFQLFELLGM